ncbi:hypothetical protein GYMLUDRAFT_246335 [Collybiopsis luxurians FD-317 M1]|uniref:CCHC-type domain-containing protein n=1 Tax=Collybiopsis luxurians FD-317 M1 TaxID=944289 RepID=A0A0D0B4R4_9AGAR|nr:hypothetical protein GYMLUDRAFT_246335 [Collybiopsis luxurians FD-317 M1]
MANDNNIANAASNSSTLNNSSGGSGSRTNTDHNSGSFRPAPPRFDPGTQTESGTHLHTGLNLGTNVAGSSTPRETLYSTSAPSSSLGLGPLGAQRGHSGSSRAGSLPPLPPLPPLAPRQPGGHGEFGDSDSRGVQDLSGDEDEDDSSADSAGGGASARRVAAGNGPSVSAELAALCERVAKLEALSDLATAALNPIAQEKIHAVAVANSLQKSSKVVALPSIVPGHMASPLDIHEYLPSFYPPPPSCARSTPPEKVIEAVKQGRYIPYTALSQAARLKAVSGDQEVSIAADGSLALKGLDCKGEHAISELEWVQASKLVVNLFRKFHGEAHATALETHNANVLALGSLHGWRRAVEYDICQCETWSFNPTYDISIRNSELILLLATRPAATPSQPISYSTVQPHTSSGHHRKAERQPSQSRKRPREDDQMCFRCGFRGHLPGNCEATTTAAKHTPAMPSSNSKSRHTLMDASGHQFCFNWAKTLSCTFGEACLNTHSCSVCSSSSHGAGKCNFQA